MGTVRAILPHVLPLQGSTHCLKWVCSICSGSIWSALIHDMTVSRFAMPIGDRVGYQR